MDELKPYQKGTAIKLYVVRGISVGYWAGKGIFKDSIHNARFFVSIEHARKAATRYKDIYGTEVVEVSITEGDPVKEADNG